MKQIYIYIYIFMVPSTNGDFPKRCVFHNIIYQTKRNLRDTIINQVEEVHQILRFGPGGVMEDGWSLHGEDDGPVDRFLESFKFQPKSEQKQS